MKSETLSLNKSKITLFLGLTVLFIVAASSLSVVSKLSFGHARPYYLFFVDKERNIPTYFSALLLLTASTLLGVIAFFRKRDRSADSTYWLVLSLGFAYMSADEVLQIHEKLVRPIREVLGLSQSTLGIFYFTWVIPGMAIILLLGIYFLRFLINLQKQTRIDFIVAAALYLGGAIGVELLGGFYAESHGQLNYTYCFLATVEETLEMVGVVVFIRAILSYIESNYPKITIELKS